MGELREPESTTKKLEEIAKETNPREALIKIADLFNNYIPEEEEVVSRYDEKTGKPLEKKWRKRRNYPSQGEIHFPYSPFHSDLGTPSLTKEVINFVIKNGPVLINNDFGKYVFAYDMRCSFVDSGRMGESAIGAGGSILITKIVSEL